MFLWQLHQTCPIKTENYILQHAVALLLSLAFHVAFPQLHPFLRRLQAANCVHHVFAMGGTDNDHRTLQASASERRKLQGHRGLKRIEKIRNETGQVESSSIVVSFWLLYCFNMCPSLLCGVGFSRFSCFNPCCCSATRLLKPPLAERIHFSAECLDPDDHVFTLRAPMQAGDAAELFQLIPALVLTRKFLIKYV